MGEPAAVFLMYDPGTDAIGLRKAEPRTMNAYPLRSYSHNRYRVSAKTLCDRHQIKYDSTVQFLETSIEEGSLVANLLKTRSTAKKRKKATK